MINNFHICVNVFNGVLFFFKGDETEEEIDFTKPLPKEALPKLDHVHVGEECCEDSSEEGESVDFFAEGRRKTKKDQDENLGTKRFVVVLMILPIIFSAGYVAYELIEKYAIGKVATEKFAFQNYSFLIGLLVVLVIGIAKLPNVIAKLLFTIGIVFLAIIISTYQVYGCSPIELKNDMIGTWFSLKTKALTFTERSYISSQCYKSFYFQAPYFLSVIEPTVTLRADVSDLADILKLENITPEGCIDENDSYFTLVSKRSVKKRFHRLYLIAVAQSDLKILLRKSLAWSLEDKDKYLLSLTGHVKDLDDCADKIKSNLENSEYHVRPVQFTLTAVKYIDRYVKLKHSVNEDMY